MSFAGSITSKTIVYSCNRVVSTGSRACRDPPKGGTGHRRRAVQVRAARVHQGTSASQRSGARKWRRDARRGPCAYLHPLGLFTEQIAAAGLMDSEFTNAPPVVAPPNGNKAVIGTNPISMSLPDGGMPWDFSTSAVALGKITMTKAAGDKIPLGWAVDADGKPTTDPDAALKGALVSAGGYKGGGLGPMAEVLTAGMTGSVNSLDVSGLKLPDGKPHDLGQFYILMEPQAGFAARLARVADAVAAQDGACIAGQSR